MAGFKFLYPGTNSYYIAEVRLLAYNIAIKSNRTLQKIMRSITHLIIATGLALAIAGCSGAHADVADNGAGGSEAFVRKLEATPKSERMQIVMTNASAINKIKRSNDQALKDRLIKSMELGK